MREGKLCSGVPSLQTILWSNGQIQKQSVEELFLDKTDSYLLFSLVSRAVLSFEMVPKFLDNWASVLLPKESVPSW